MGKSSVYGAWEPAYFATEDFDTLSAAVRQYGFIMIALSVRNYGGILAADARRTESWVFEAVRRQLEQFGRRLLSV